VGFGDAAVCLVDVYAHYDILGYFDASGETTLGILFLFAGFLWRQIFL
jgi:hypothetical protein